MKLLIVDDEPDTTFLFKQQLEPYTSEGAFSLIFASDGVQALDYLQHCSPGDLPLIALVDINMPGMDGLTLVGHMMEMYPFIRVIMVTAYGDMTNIRKAMNFGAFDFVTKPVDFNDLCMTINKAMGQITGEREQAQEKQELTYKTFIHRSKYGLLLRFLHHFSEEMSRLFNPEYTPTSLEKVLERYEKLTILQAIARYEGNVSKAAEELEVTRQHIHRKLKEYERDV